jgi:rhomboid protease GluP
VIPDPAPIAEPPVPITWVSFGVLAGSVIVFLLDALFFQGQLKAMGTLYGPAVAAGEWWRPFTAVFVHGNQIHLLFNMMAVMSLGRDVEISIGSFRFLIASIVGAMGSAIVVLMWKFDQPTVGASGMILAWAGALLPIATEATRRQLGIWLAQIAVISLLPMISGAGHLGGFLFGLPCGWVMRRPATLFQTLAPILVFVSAVLLYLAGTGRLTI